MANKMIEFEDVVNSQQVDIEITNAVKRENVEIYDVNGLTTSGSGFRFLADDGDYKTLGTGGGGDMYKFVYDTNDSGVVDNTERVGNKTAIQVVAHIDSKNNPHEVNKTDVGLSNVPNLNTTDAVMNEHPHSNLNALNNITMYGSGNNYLADDGVYKPVSGGGGAEWGSIIGDITTQDDLQQQFDTKAPMSHTTDTNNPHGVTKAHVGLSNVDDTSDVDKPVSTATQTALDLKFDIAEHIDAPSGGDDAGKPIILNTSGLIDSALLSFDDKYLVSGWNPSECGDPATGCEYPDTTGHNPGAYWILYGLPGSDYSTDGAIIKGSYTFVEGDLAGTTVFDGDYMVLADTGWVLIHGTADDPTAYYRLDGTQPIVSAFAGGGQTISDIADGVADTDAISVAQLNTHSNAVDNPHTVTKAQVGLSNVPDLDTTNAVDHVGLIDNPHSVTSTQVGLGYVIDTGDGSQYLTNDGTYKTVTGGVTDHNSLSGRDVANGHPIGAITDLQSSLDVKVNSDTSEAGTVRVNNMVSLTQTEFDALTPVSTTLYVIVG